MYAAEALLKHDQIGEAIQLLNPETVCDVSVLVTPTPEFGKFHLLNDSYCDYVSL